VVSGLLRSLNTIISVLNTFIVPAFVFQYSFCCSMSAAADRTLLQQIFIRLRLIYKSPICFYAPCLTIGGIFIRPYRPNPITTPSHYNHFPHSLLASPTSHSPLAFLSTNQLNLQHVYRSKKSYQNIWRAKSSR